MPQTHLSPDNSIWTQSFRVTHYFVDPDGHLSANGLAFMLQEVAHNHASARSLGFEQLFADHKAWVLTRQAIKLYQIPKLSDTVRIESWVHETSPSISVRDFHILDSHNEVIGLTRTSWMIIDFIHRKPVRMPAEVLSLIPHLPNRLKENIILEKIPLPETQGKATKFEVRFSDLDMNNHVNNITYVRWVMDGHELEMRNKYSLEMIEMNYLNEALYGDSLVSITRPLENGRSFITDIRNEKDNREIARVRTFWKPKDI